MNQELAKNKAGVIRNDILTDILTAKEIELYLKKIYAYVFTSEVLLFFQVISMILRIIILVLRSFC
jgi:hypothetical protein